MSNIKKRTFSLLLVLAMMASLGSAFAYEAQDIMTLQDFVTSQGVEIDETTVIEIVDYPSSEKEESSTSRASSGAAGQYIKITQIQENGSVEQILILPYAVDENDALTKVTLVESSSSLLRAGQSPTINFSNVGIAVMVTAAWDYGGYGVKPLGVIGAWKRTSGSSTVTNLSVYYRAGGHLVDYVNGDTIIQQNFTYSLGFSQSSPSQNVYYGPYTPWPYNANYSIYFNGAMNGGHYVDVTITVSGTKYNDTVAF